MLPPDLIGSWWLTRAVDDRRGGEQWRVTGTLTLARVDRHTIGWDEAGSMVRLGSTDARACSTRHLLREDADGAWSVHFRDDRPFHPWAWEQELTHACPPDTYAGLLAGTTAGWTVRWTATGPAKSYTSHSSYRPISALVRER